MNSTTHFFFAWSYASSSSNLLSLLILCSRIDFRQFIKQNRIVYNKQGTQDREHEDKNSEETVSETLTQNGGSLPEADHKFGSVLSVHTNREKFEVNNLHGPQYVPNESRSQGLGHGGLCSERDPGSFKYILLWTIGRTTKTIVLNKQKNTWHLRQFIFL